MAKKAKTIHVDYNLNEIEVGGGSFHIPEGAYRMKCKSCEEAESNAGNQMVVWLFTGLEGAAKNRTFYLRVALTEKTGWKLKQTLMGFGETEWDDDGYDIDPENYIGQEVVGRVTDDEYNNRPVSRLDELLAPDAEEGETAEASEEEDTKPARGKPQLVNGKGTNGKARTLHKLDADLVGDMKRKQLQEVVEDYKLDLDLSDYKNDAVAAKQVVKELGRNDMLA